MNADQLRAQSQPLMYRDALVERLGGLADARWRLVKATANALVNKER